MPIAVIALYAIFLGVGWRASRKAKGGTAADLILAGRAMPLWLATLTMTATWVDGGYLLGTAEGTFKSSLASGLQGGVCFGLSLILGGIFFARVMRRHEFTTLIDPFEARFGAVWAVVLFVPAMLAEVFWSAELLVAIGSTLGVMLDMPVVTAILLSALVVIAYTMAGGMWSVAYTDALQLGLVAVGLAVALPFALDAAGGFSASWHGYVAARADRGGDPSRRNLLERAGTGRVVGIEPDADAGRHSRGTAISSACCPASRPPRRSGIRCWRGC